MDNDMSNHPVDTYAPVAKKEKKIKGKPNKNLK
jgi:hypothetical protein